MCVFERALVARSKLSFDSIERYSAFATDAVCADTARRVTRSAAVKIARFLRGLPTFSHGASVANFHASGMLTHNR